MVAPNINETILVLVEPNSSRSSSLQDQHPTVSRRMSNRTIVARASLKGFSPDTVLILKESFESWGKENATNISELFTNKKRERKTQHAVVTLQRVMRGWLSRQQTRIVQLERKLNAIRSDTRNEIALIQQEKLRQMQEIRRQVELEHQMEKEGSNSTLSKAKKIIDELRHENQTIRRQNNEIHFKILKLQLAQDRLENAQKRAERSLVEIASHIEQTKQRIAENKRAESLLADACNKHVEALKEIHDASLTEQSIRGRYGTTTQHILDTLRARKEKCNSDLRDELIRTLLQHQQAVGH